MLAMAPKCGTRIRYTCGILVYLGGDNLVSGIEEGRDLSGHIPIEWCISSSLRVLQI
jgi:hypothetical protein